jgi:hypothetical protein
MDPSNRVKALFCTTATLAALFCSGCEARVGRDAPPSVQADGGCTDALTACASRCIDLQIDEANCGACGHSCLGAACAGGYCQPEVLAAGSPASLAVDDGGVYWTDTATGRVMRCPLGGCADGGGEALFDMGDSGAPGNPGNPGGPAFGGLAVEAGHVVFSVDEPGAVLPHGGTSGMATIYTCPTSGCGGAPALLAAEPGSGSALVTDLRSDVFWLQSADSSVHACSWLGCSGSPRIIAPSMVNASPRGLATDGEHVYFTMPGGSLGWCKAAGGSCTFDVPIGTNEALDALTAGPSGLYGTSGDRVLRIQPNFTDSTMSAQTLLAVVPSPGHLALDDVQVYFTSQDKGGAIYRCGLGGCSGTPFLVAEGLGALGDLEVDADRIYVVVGGNTIVWLAK